MREIPLPSLTIVGRETRRNSVIPRAKAKVEEFSDAVRVSMNGDAIATILTDIATPLGTLHFESWAREIAQSMANIINLQISLGKLTSDGIKVEKTNDKER